MNENAEYKPDCKPQENGEEKAPCEAETIPQSKEDEILIPVKFNKELKNITASEAAELAQKGMKFDIISENYERIKQLAKNDGHSVAEFLNALEERRTNEKKNELLEKCGGNNELAEHILQLEGLKPEKEESGIEELIAEIPEIKDISDVPEEVIQSASAKGTSLLDEYLRYRLRCEREAQLAAGRSKTAAASSVGSQRQQTGDENPAAAEFLRGLWG